MSVETELTSNQVESYLKSHRDFFTDHLDLLENLTIPHPSGNAVSLITKQLEIFRSKHLELETQLNTLIEIARENDTSFIRMHELTLAMLEASTTEELVANLEHVLFECFLADFVCIRIIRENADPAIANLCIPAEDQELLHFQKIMQSNMPKCSRPTLPQATFLFGSAAAEIKSSAIIPMMFTELEGLVAIGSRKENRFSQTQGSLFLTQIGEIVGTRLISLLRSDT